MWCVQYNTCLCHLLGRGGSPAVVVSDEDHLTWLFPHLFSSSLPLFLFPSLSLSLSPSLVSLPLSLSLEDQQKAAMKSYVNNTNPASQPPAKTGRKIVASKEDWTPPTNHLYEDMPAAETEEEVPVSPLEAWLGGAQFIDCFGERASREKLENSDVIGVSERAGERGRQGGGREGVREEGREGERDGGREGGWEGRREGGRERGMEGGREGRREGGREGGREGWREGRREGEREGGRERGREGGRGGREGCEYRVEV